MGETRSINLNRPPFKLQIVKNNNISMFDGCKESEISSSKLKDEMSSAELRKNDSHSDFDTLDNSNFNSKGVGRLRPQKNQNRGRSETANKINFRVYKDANEVYPQAHVREN